MLKIPQTLLDDAELPYEEYVNHAWRQAMDSNLGKAPPLILGPRAKKAVKRLAKKLGVKLSEICDDVDCPEI